MEWCIISRNNVIHVTYLISGVSVNQRSVRHARFLINTFTQALNTLHYSSADWQFNSTKNIEIVLKLYLGTNITFMMVCAMGGRV